MNLNKWSSQGYNKRVCAFTTLGGVTISQMMKSVECDIAAVTVGDDELSSLRMFSVFGR